MVLFVSPKRKNLELKLGAICKCKLDATAHLRCAALHRNR
jgi:hypothetical protein